MRKQFVFIAALIAIIGLIACTPTPSIPIVDHDVLSRVVDCIPGLVNPPTSLWPNNTTESDVDGIRFAWTYHPEPGCGTDGFLLSIHEDVSGRLGVASWFLPTELEAITVRPSFLEDCNKYYWTVAAIGDGSSVTSEPAVFWTDFSGSCPVWESCDSGNLEFNYENFSPHNGSAIYSLAPQLLWDIQPPFCAVDNYHWVISETPTFENKITSGDTTDFTHVPEVPHYLEDCHLYFWKVTAQSGDNTQVSNTQWFFTDVNALISTDPFRRCGHLHTMCSTSYVPETLSLATPSEGGTVRRLNPQLVWSYDYSCRPPTFDLVVSESPALTSPILNITDHWGDMWTEFHTDVDYLEDCTTYYWQVTASSDLEILPGESSYAEVISPIGMFHTDVNGTCPVSGGSTKATLMGLSVGCITLNTQFAFLDFDQRLAGNYEVHIKNETWPCYSEANSPKRLICSGPAVEGGIFANLEIWDKDINKMFLSQQVTTPNCQEEIKEEIEPSTCPTPTIPCVQYGSGCSFDSDSCRCEKQDGSPCP